MIRDQGLELRRETQNGRQVRPLQREEGIGLRNGGVERSRPRTLKTASMRPRCLGLKELCVWEIEAAPLQNRGGQELRGGDLNLANGQGWDGEVNCDGGSRWAPGGLQGRRQKLDHTGNADKE